MSMGISACGTHVPPLTDFGGSDAKVEELIQNVVHAVRCEVYNAVRSVVYASYPRLRQGATFLSDWGAEMLLTLQIDETTTISPNAVWLVPSPITALFTLGAGVTGSSHATRIEKLNFFYSVAEVRAAEHAICNSKPGSDSLLIQSDLGLYQWLEGQVIAVKDGEMTIPNTSDSVFKQNVLQHEIKFDVLQQQEV